LKKTTFALLSLAAVSSHAIMLDDFEHNNAGLYTFIGGTGTTIAPAAGVGTAGSFGGLYGLAPAGYAARQDIMTSPGNIYTAMVRTNNVPASGGRIYLGVGASGTGMYSAVFAPNTQQLLIQNNSGFGFVTVQTAAATIAQSTWYQLHMSWAANGDMQASLYDETGTTLVSQTGVWASGVVTPGWLGYRGFSSSPANTVIDNIQSVVPEPGTLMVVLAGIAGIALRRRRR
jgi:hypothetical protein